MPDPARFAAAMSRRLRLAAVTVIALFAVKVAAAAIAPAANPSAGADIVRAEPVHNREILEHME